MRKTWLTLVVLLATLAALSYYATDVVMMSRRSGNSIAAHARVYALRSRQLQSPLSDLPVPTELPPNTTAPFRADLPPLIVYRVYYDNRTSKGAVRVLTLSQCVRTNDINWRLWLLADGDSLGKARRPLKAMTTENVACPWPYAPHCRWNAWLFETGEVEKPPGGQVTLQWGGRLLTLPLHETPPLEDSLQVCVASLYWYNDWPRLILFVELWRVQASKIVIYVNSITDAVRVVLDYYVASGVVEVLHWPMFPLTADEDPNKSVYRLSHSLSHNDCSMRATSKFVALVDIDEYFHVRTNGTLLDYLRRTLAKNPHAGAFYFKHYGLMFKDNKLDGDDFSGIEGATVKTVSRTGKSVFMPARTHRASTHWASKHVTNYSAVTINETDALYLHYRVDYIGMSVGKEVPLGADSPFNASLIAATQREKRAIFGEETPHFAANVSVYLNACMKDWTKTCKVPAACHDQLLPLDDWLFVDGTPSSHFTLL